MFRWSGIVMSLDFEGVYRHPGAILRWICQISAQAKPWQTSFTQILSNPGGCEPGFPSLIPVLIQKHEDLTTHTQSRDVFADSKKTSLLWVWVCLDMGSGSAYACRLPIQTHGGGNHFLPREIFIFCDPANLALWNCGG